MRAAVQGEVDGIVVSEGSALRYSRDGKLVPAAVLGRKRSSAMPDVPTVFESVSLSPENAWWIDFRAAMNDIGRALIAAPDIPADRAKTLATAVGAVLTDPAVIAETKAKNRPLGYAPPEALRQWVADALTSLEGARLERVRHVVLEKYY